MPPRFSGVLTLVLTRAHALHEKRGQLHLKLPSLLDRYFSPAELDCFKFGIYPFLRASRAIVLPVGREYAVIQSVDHTVTVEIGPTGIRLPVTRKKCVI